MKPIDVALEAWEKLPEVRKGESTTTDLLGRKVIKLHHMVVVMPVDTDWPEEKKTNFHQIQIIAFPKPEHIKDFVDAVNGVKRLGPADKNPGGIGTITLNVGMGKLGNYLFLDEAQSHYKKAGAKETGGHLLSKALARRYGTWIQDSLPHVLKIARNRRLDLIVTNPLLFKEGDELPLAPSHLHRELLKVIDKHGLDYQYEKEGLRFKH